MFDIKYNAPMPSGRIICSETRHWADGIQTVTWILSAEDGYVYRCSENAGHRVLEDYGQARELTKHLPEDHRIIEVLRDWNVID